MPRSQLNGFLAGAFDFHAVSFHARIVLERVMDDAAVESVERLEFHHIAPTANFFRGFVRFLHQRIAGLGAVTADVHHHLRDVRILLEKDSVHQVLQVGKGLPLAADQAAGIFRLHVQEESFFQLVLFDGGLEAKVLEDFFENGFR